MTRPYAPSRAALLCAALVCLLSASGQAAAQQAYLTTKTPYAPRQQASQLEPAPAGFHVVHTQLLARHGARGMSSMKDDLALYNLWKLAQQDGALTPLGEALGADLEKLLRANALLGAGVPGITNPGYGNLSQTGIAEHRQLAQRVVQRLPELFPPQPPARAAGIGANIRVLNSGVDRAHDSAYFFTQSLVQTRPWTQPLLQEPVLSGYPDTAPRDQEPGVNRFLLYFHRLHAKTDGVTHADDPLLAVFQHSRDLQAYQHSAEVKDRLEQRKRDPRLAVAARHTLERLFQPAWVDRLAAGGIQASNTGSFSYTTADGRFTNRLVGDGKLRLANTVDALFALSNVYEIAPGMQHELGFDFARYLPPEAARLLAEHNDAEDFYAKGPGMTEHTPVTYAMAGALLQDFFKAAQDGAAGGGSGDGGGRQIATFRFAHAETVVPFASLLGVAGMATPLPRAENYSYANSSWRGETVAPYAANVQWDTFVNGKGQAVVRKLYNEQEVDFHPRCTDARWKPKGHYYDLRRLAACYARLGY